MLLAQMLSVPARTEVSGPLRVDWLTATVAPRPGSTLAR
jgi:hypothetical protein